MTNRTDHMTGRLMKDQGTEWDTASAHFAGGAVVTILRGRRPRHFPRSRSSNRMMMGSVTKLSGNTCISSLEIVSYKPSTQIADKGVKP